MRSFLSSLLPSKVKTTATIAVGTAIGLYAVYKLMSNNALAPQAPLVAPNQNRNPLGENPPIAEDSKKEILESHLRCPITQDLMTDPVVNAVGQTYERAAIEEWYETHDTDPHTNERVPHKGLTSIFIVKSLTSEVKEGKLSFFEKKQELPVPSSESGVPAPQPVSHEIKVMPPHIIDLAGSMPIAPVEGGVLTRPAVLASEEAARRCSATPEILSKLAAYANADSFLNTVRKHYQLPATVLFSELKKELTLLPVNTTQEARTVKLKTIMTNILRRDPGTSGDFDKALRFTWNKITDYYPEVAASYPKLPEKRENNSMHADYLALGGRRENIPEFIENDQNYAFR